MVETPFQILMTSLSIFNAMYAVIVCVYSLSGLSSAYQFPKRSKSCFVIPAGYSLGYILMTVEWIYSDYGKVIGSFSDITWSLLELTALIYMHVVVYLNKRPRRLVNMQRRKDDKIDDDIDDPLIKIEPHIK